MVNSPSANSESPAGEDRRPAECPPDNQLPENSKENLDAKLDHAVEETFPTSDPISVQITKGGAIDYDQPARSDTSGSESRGHEDGGTGEDLLGKATDTLRNVAGSASDTARKAYNRGKPYISQARSRYPQAERYYQDSRRAIGQQVSDNPLLALLVAGAVGYALAWLIHGIHGGEDRRVPKFAKTGRGYARR